MIKGLVAKTLLVLRRFAYSFYSNNKRISGVYIAHQPVVIRGEGSIVFNSDVHFGVINSPKFINTYAYIEARQETASISFGNNVHINNAFSVVSEKKITIKDHVLIGSNCSISDSNFHDLSSEFRKNTDPNPEEIIINNNVFIGNNVTILKGVVIGENSVIASNSVVTKSFPENVVIGGNPAKEISKVV